jgi:tRNA(Ile)-lysidine synthase
MEAARRARYALLADWAREAGLGHVALAHTADDQAETFLLGLGRAAGLDGLTGMRAGWSQGGVRFVRPLLEVGRADLRDYLRQRGQGWIEDPSNEDPRFDRVKARRALAALAPLGVSVGGIAGSMAHLRAAQAALQEVTQAAARRIGRCRAGMIEMDHDGWRGLPSELRRRLLVAALREVSGADHAPRASAVARLIERAMAGGEATLWGCRMRAGGGVLRILREPKAAAGRIAAPGTLWDARWCVEGPFAPGMEIRALGAAGLRGCKDWRGTGLPREALVVTPAVWQEDRLVSAPLAGLAAGFSARIVAPEALFAVSH